MAACSPLVTLRLCRGEGLDRGGPDLSARRVDAGRGGFAAPPEEADDESSERTRTLDAGSLHEPADLLRGGLGGAPWESVHFIIPHDQAWQ
jgi:hypothetical protein